MPLQAFASEDNLARQQKSESLESTIEIVIFDKTDGYYLDKHFVIQPGHTYQVIAKAESYFTKLPHSPRINITLPEQIALGETAHIVASMTSTADAQIISDSYQVDYEILGESQTSDLPSNAVPFVKLNYIEDSAQITVMFDSDTNLYEETFSINGEDLLTDHRGYSISYRNSETGPYVVSMCFQAERDYTIIPELNGARVVALIAAFIIGILVGGLGVILGLCIHNKSSVQYYSEEEEEEEEEK